MAYKPMFPNEMIINCLYAEGGILDKRPFSIINPEYINANIVVGVHDSNIWFEKEGVFGFSIDKDIATVILKKIADETAISIKFDDNIDLANKMASALELIINDNQIA